MTVVIYVPVIPFQQLLNETYLVGLSILLTYNCLQAGIAIHQFANLYLHDGLHIQRASSLTEAEQKYHSENKVFHWEPLPFIDRVMAYRRKWLLITIVIQIDFSIRSMKQYWK